MEDVEQLQKIYAYLTRSEILAMAAGKTCGEHRLVAEMLLKADDDVSHLIALTFRFHLINHETEA